MKRNHPLNKMSASSIPLFETGQDIWAISPSDSREHAGTVVVATATEVSVLWAHSGRKETVDIDAVRPMFAFGTSKRTSISASEDGDSEKRLRKEEGIKSPDSQDDLKDKEIAELRAALLSSNEKGERHQNEVKNLIWTNLSQQRQHQQVLTYAITQQIEMNELNVKYKFQTDKILDLEEQLEAIESPERQVGLKDKGIAELRAELTSANKKVEEKQAEVKRLKWKYNFQADEILDLEEELEETKKNRANERRLYEKEKAHVAAHLQHADSSYRLKLQRLDDREKRYVDQSLKSEKKLEKQMDEIKDLQARVIDKSRTVERLKTKVKEMEGTCDDQKDRIAMLIRENEIKKIEIAGLERLAERTRDKVCYRGAEKVSKLKGLSKECGDTVNEKMLGGGTAQIGDGSVVPADQARQDEASFPTPQKDNELQLPQATPSPQLV